MLRATGLALLAVSCTQPAPVATQPAPTASAAVAAPLSGLHFDIGALDATADPCTDFYDYACGGWRATHPIPADETRWSRYAEMTAVNRERERMIIEDAAKGKAGTTAAERRVGAYYAACMDEKRIEELGLGPIRDALTRIEAIRTAADAAEVVADLHVHWIDALFAAYIDPDPHDAKRIMLWLDTGVLGLPDPAGYSRTDDDAVALRDQYVAHLQRLFQLLGDSAEEAKLSASGVLVFEKSLAANALSAAERRRIDAKDHPMTLAELGARYPSIDWAAYFARIGAPGIERVNVAEPAWLDAVNSAMSSPDLAGLRDTLRVLMVRAFHTDLPKAIDEEIFDFRQRRLRGAKEMAPRWKQCVQLVDRDVGDDVGRIFVARHFHAGARRRVKKMVDALIAAYREDIASRDWLGASAREAAEAKLSAILVVLGASNRPRSFDALVVDPSDAFGNDWRAQALRVALTMADVGKPADREKFFDSLPQETDAFGSKAMNAVGITAGFLQPPVFDARMDDAVNFGGLGSVIGHELSHRFDDEGRKYDAEGNLAPWWSEEDVARFVERAECFVEEYAKFHTDDGTPIDGKLTLGENIADNGGIRLSYAALRPSENGPRIDGFTPAQRFFLAWGQIRCENATPEAQRRAAETDPHAPGRWRVNGVVSNMPEFARAFGCAAGTPMAPAKRCAVW